MFPELVERVKRFIPDSSLVTLDLKETGVTFDAAHAAWYLKNGYPNIYALLSGGMPAWSGETVSLQAALNHSVIWACNQVISETIGSLPAHVIQKVGNAKQEAVGLPAYNLFKMAPNDEMSAQAFREILTSHCVLQGNGYAKILRRSGTGVAIGLDLLLPSMVQVDREKEGAKRLVYVVSEERGPSKVYVIEPNKPQDILHLKGLGWNGMQGFSVITMGRQSMGTAIAAERNVGRFWAGGGRVPYVLMMDRSEERRVGKECRSR